MNSLHTAAGDGLSLRVVWRRRIRRWWSDFHWPVIGGLAVVALLLGWEGFRQHFEAVGKPRSSWDYLYLSVQLFGLRSGSIEPPVGWMLNISRWLAPLVAAYAALCALAAVLREHVRIFRLRFLRGHAVICGLGRKGFQLVRSFLEHGLPVVVLELNGDNPEIGTCHDLGAIVLRGSAADPDLLAKARVSHAAHLIAMTGDDGTNVEIAVQAHRLVTSRGTASGRRLACCVHIVDLDLCTLLKQHRLFTDTDDAFEVRVVNVYENCARLLFATHLVERSPASETDSRPMHLIVVGFGQMGQSVVLQAVRIGHFANGRKLRVTVVDREVERAKGSFDRRHPRFSAVCDAEFIQGDARQLRTLERMAESAADTACLSSVVLCMDDDCGNLSCALALLPRLKDRDIPVLVRMNQSAGLAMLLESEGEKPKGVERVHAFGMVDQTCTRKGVLHEELDVLARALHGDFVERRLKEGRPSSDPAMAPWDKLEEVYKESNRQQADHIPVKLRAVGCISAPPLPDQQAVEQFEPAEVELLAGMEHARWMAERLLVNWTYAPGPKSDERKTSPHLVSWDQLPDDIKKYDREFVQNIPHVLGLIGERIYRRKPSLVAP